MNNNNAWGIILGAIVVLAIIGGFIWYSNEPQVADEYNMDGGKGELYVGFTDATADIKNVNEVNLEIEKVEVYSESRGWVTVSEQSKTYNLLALKSANRAEFYAKGELDAGDYTRVRITLGDTVVKTKTKGDVKAFPAGRHIVMNLPISVAAEQATSVLLDVFADKSLHTTSDSKWVFAPVIMAESRSNTQVNVSGDNTYTSAGGKMDASANVGMDLAGASRMNFSLTSGSDLKVDDSSSGIVKFMLGGQTFLGTGAIREEPLTGSVNTNTNTNVNTNTNNGGANIDLNGALNGSLY